MNNPSVAHAQLLSLTEIAAWQIPNVTQTTPKVTAALPAMQRGAVWKPAQTESLWDSLARGFPIGAFLLTRFDADRGIQDFKFQQPGSKVNADHHLLDGQQRATAIALGFLDPWQHADQDTRAVLWVDLAPPLENSDQAFIFRVLTRSHPWGYKRSDPRSPIPVGQIRKALDAYGVAVPALVGKRPSEIPLTHVWPWDADAPIPVPMLIDAIQSTEDPIAALRARLATLPFWKTGEDIPEWQSKVLSALEGKNSSLAERLLGLIEGLKGVLTESNYGIPALVLPHTAKADLVKTQDVEVQDPVEVLFIRVNQAGTRLEGEELIYSILKSTWPEAPNWIDQTLKHKLMMPSRLVLMAARLVLAENSPERAPPPPDIARFRRLIHGVDREEPEFKARLQGLIQGERATRILETAKRLLTEGSWALPPVLAADVAHSAPDIMFLFLRWIDRMLASEQDPCALGKTAKQRILGMLTALTWFAADHRQCLSALWQPLQSCTPENLTKFFGPKCLKQALSLGYRDSLQMLPLPDPDTLQKVLKDCVTSPHGEYGGFGNPEHDFWKNWNRWGWMSGRLTGSLKDWYTTNQGGLWWREAKEGEELIDLNAKYQAAWAGFIDKIWTEKRLLLYVQGQWLIRWFPDYDPTLPEQIEDMNRPWDYDHIHPENYIRSVNNLPKIIKDWHGSIGNFRAWPLELNRMDQDHSPKKKLSDADGADKPERRYGMKSQEDERRASFVGEDSDWPLWKKSVPDDGKWFPHQYLAKPQEYGAYRLALVKAITTRFAAIYRHWYEQLRIGDLMP